MVKSLRIALLLLAFAVPKSAAGRTITQTATADLGFSGVRISVTSTFPVLSAGIDRRLLTVIGPSGVRRVAHLHAGGVYVGPSSLNLYYLGDDNFAVLNPVDCVIIDAIHVRLRKCAPPPCAAKHASGTYLGRWDWMNGFDRPKGEFALRYRYLPFYDAAEDLTCPTKAK